MVPLALTGESCCYWIIYSSLLFSNFSPSSSIQSPLFQPPQWLCSCFQACRDVSSADSLLQEVMQHRPSAAIILEMKVGKVGGVWRRKCCLKEHLLQIRGESALQQTWERLVFICHFFAQGRRSKGHRSIAPEQVTQCFALKAVLTTQACNLLPMKSKSKSSFPGEVQVACVQSQRTTLKWRVVGRKPTVHKVQHSTYFSWRISQSFSFRVTLLHVSA